MRTSWKVAAGAAVIVIAAALAAWIARPAPAPLPQVPLALTGGFAPPSSFAKKCGTERVGFVGYLLRGSQSFQPRPCAVGGPAVPQDGPGLAIYVPNDAQDFTDLGLTPPTHLFLAQEASGNLADSIGAFTLTANATPLYQQARSGWTRTFTGFNQVANQRVAGGAGVGPNPATTDVLWVGYMVSDTLPGAARGVMAVGANVVVMLINTTGALRLSVAGVTVDDTTTRPDLDDLVHPIVILHDATNSRTVLYTDEAKTPGTFAAATDGTKGFGGNAVGSASPPAASGVFWGAVWTGADARLSDAQVKTLLQTLGWTIPWTGIGETKCDPWLPSSLLSSSPSWAAATPMPSCRPPRATPRSTARFQMTA
jgi:hypothetical protein